jgi:hypothetical protein
MNETKHTPGPWEARRRSLIIGAVYEVWAYIPESIPITEVSNGANARLIAAAPELLEALKDLLFFCEEMDPKAAWLEPWNKAKAAIAKAEGR